MKNRFTLGVLAVGMLSLCVLGACGNHQEEVYEEFSFNKHKITWALTEEELLK